MEHPPTPHVSELMRLDGLGALVTGASGGLGAAVAQRLAEAGAHVAAHYRSQRTAAERLAADIVAAGGRAAPVAGDLTDPAGAPDVFTEAERAVGPIGAVVHCAALQPVAALDDMTHTDWAEVTRTNLDSMFLVTQTAAKRARAAGRPCAIVLVSSVEAFAPARGHAHYCASKAAMQMFVKSAAVEFGSAGVRVNAVAPGLARRRRPLARGRAHGAHRPSGRGRRRRAFSLRARLALDHRRRPNRRRRRRSEPDLVSRA